MALFPYFFFAARDCVLNRFNYCFDTPFLRESLHQRTLPALPALPREKAMIRLLWPASLLCLLLAYVGVSPTLQADVDRAAVRQIPVSYRDTPADI